ncbi:MAG: hypothetical protein ACOYN0_07300 [Phycisphaerales bacterium]
MKPIIIGVLFGSALALSAYGQVAPRSQFTVELSTDGQNWSRTLVVDPSLTAVVFGRTSISYIRNDGPAVLGLTIAKSQPTLAGWSAGDTILPFEAANRVAEADYSTTDGDGFALGRTYGQTIADAVIVHQYDFAGTSYARFAQAVATNHPGQGAGDNNVSGLRGINNSGASLAANFGTTDVRLFTWGMSFAQSRSGSLDVNIPVESFRTSNGERSSLWFSSITSPFTFEEAPMLETLGANIRFVPAPGSFALAAVAGLVLFPRRRDRQTPRARA